MAVNCCRMHGDICTIYTAGDGLAIPVRSCSVLQIHFRAAIGAISRLYLSVISFVDTPPRINPGDSRFTDRCPQAGLAQSPRALGSGVSRPTVQRLRQQAQTFVQDVFGGIYVPVVDGTADGANPLPDGQVLGSRPLCAAVGAELGGREEFIHTDNRFPVPRRLVLQLPPELSPACV